MDQDSAAKIAEQRIKKPSVSGNVYAHSWPQDGVSGIAVNLKFGKEFDEESATFIRSLQRDVATLHHPPGCDTIRSVVDHEFAHQLDHLLALSKDESIISLFNQARAKGIKNEVSGYADKNIAEFIAECWAESCNSPDPRPSARSVAEIVRARYRSRFPA